GGCGPASPAVICQDGQRLGPLLRSTCHTDDGWWPRSTAGTGIREGAAPTCTLGWALCLLASSCAWSYAGAIQGANSTCKASLLLQAGTPCCLAGKSKAKEG